jgi:cell wall assembly regulator SMI1
VPNGPTPGTLRVEPEWDPLRGDPRFDKIITALAPKTAGE